MLFRDNYWFLSNFYPCMIKYNGRTYSCVETAFQAQKCANESQMNDFTMGNIYTLPRDAKSAGRKVALRSDWEVVKDSIMLDLLRIKFEYPELKQLLLETGDKSIIEENTWNDTYWGVCNGKGENRLGQLIMTVRKEIKDKSKRS